jgi:probable O-glycosylation ligase (exosortase A-associated)
MLFPLSIFLAQYPPMKILKWPLIGAALTVPLSVIGTQSRGGFVALAAVLFMFLMKSKHKITILVIAIPLGVATINFMPESWSNRMESTEEATDDDSFMGRVSMWKFSSNVTKDHPIEGGGFNVFYLRYLGPMYMPSGWKQRAPHSIYFEVLGEHGYVGLLLFLTMLFTGWFSGGANAKRFRKYEETKWIADLSVATQLSLVGYAVGGLTVNIAIFDLFYHLLIVLVICRVVGDRIIEKGAVPIEEKREQTVKDKSKWKPSRPESISEPEKGSLI